ncbi:MAG: amidohydrolase family protein, partial [Planctomycetota bacterium]
MRTLRQLIAAAAAALTVVATAGPAGAQEAPRRLVVRAAKVLPVSGPPIHDGCVVMENGVITAVGPAATTLVPEGARVLDAGDGWVCPGFIDLHNHIGGLMSDINDMVHPTNPELSTWPTIDPENWLLRRAARWGVTTVLLMKTHGRTPQEYLVRFPGAMKVAQGYNPERWAGDLGFSRMGMWWSLERTLDRGKAYADAWAAHTRDGGAKPATDPELEMLRGLFERKYPVIVHTAGARDIMGTVVMFKEKYGLNVIASHATFDAYRAAEAVAQADVPVNLGPRNYDMFFTRTGRMQPIGRDYVAAGVKRFSLNTDAPVLPGEELFYQGTICVRLGIDRATAIRALTLEPALAVGIADRCGS